MSNQSSFNPSSPKPHMALSVLTLAMLQISLAHADEAKQPIAIDSNNIAHVVVSANRLTDPTTPSTATSTTLTQQSLNLEQSKTSDTATALTALSGVNVQTAGGVSALPVVQGLADNRLRIMVDGVDSIASCPNHMNSPLSYVAPTAIKTAKVYTGVTPVSVSGNSIGATIVVETTKPQFAKKPLNTVKTVKATSSDKVVTTSSDNLSYTGQNITQATPVDSASPQVIIAKTAPNNSPILTHTQPTHKPWQLGDTHLETSGEVGAFYRSNGKQHGANVKVTTATPSLSLTYQANFAKADDYTAGGDFKAYTDSGNAGQMIDKDVVASTAFDSKNQSLDAAYMTGNHLWQFGYNWQHIPKELYPNQRMDMLDNRLDRYNLRYSGDMRWGTLEAQAYHENVDHYMDFGGDKRYWYGMPKSVADSKNLNGKPCSSAGTKECASGMPMYTQSQTTGVNLKASRQWDATTNVRVGAEYQDYQLDDWWTPSGGGMYPNTFQNINNGKRQRTSLYGEWEKVLNANWTSLFGLRYEHLKTQTDPIHGYNSATAPTAMPAMGNGTMDMMNQTRDAVTFNNSDLSTTDNNWNASLINRWQLSDTNNIELGLSHQMRSPSLYERYTWSTASMMAGMNNTVGDGNGYFGDPNLKPEAANKIAVTWDYKDSNDQWQFKITPYVSQITDYIDAVQWDSAANKPKAIDSKNQYSVMRYTNQNARIYGIDANAAVKLGETRLGDFGLTASLNYTNGKNTDTHSPLYNIMPLNGKLALTHQKNGWNNKIEWVGVAAKDDISQPRNEIKTAGYGLLNLSTGYDWHNITFTVGIDNALDKKYALPLGGAYMGQGRTMSMKQELGNGTSNWGTPVYGAGRSYFASLKYKF